MRLGAGRRRSSGRLSYGVRWHRTTGARAVPDPRGPTCPDRPPSETRSASSPARASGSRSSTRAPRSATTRRRRSRPPRGQMARLRDLQDRLWAEAKHSVLVVLQGIDAAGKDGTIAKVMEAFNPQGCPVTLVQGADRRGARPRLPVAGPQAHARARARSAIFNRSHYEDVLVVRVHDLVPKRVWSQALRPDQRLRADAGRRAARRSSSSSCRSTATSSASGSRTRYDDPTKRWKFSLGDLEERKLWDDYQAAFDEALSKTLDRRGRRGTSSRPTGTGSATSRSSTILADTIAGLKPAYPAPPDLPPNLVIE